MTDDNTEAQKIHNTLVPNLVKVIMEANKGEPAETLIILESLIVGILFHIGQDRERAFFILNNLTDDVKERLTDESFEMINRMRREYQEKPN